MDENGDKNFRCQYQRKQPDLRSDQFEFHRLL